MFLYIALVPLFIVGLVIIGMVAFGAIVGLISIFKPAPKKQPMDPSLAHLLRRDR